MSSQRISYVPLEKMDAAMRAEMDRCAREGTPRPESSAVRAHVPGAFWSFANSWRDIFHNGVCDHAIKELCRLYVSRSVKCEYCGNQRSIKASAKSSTKRRRGPGQFREIGSLQRAAESRARLCRSDHVAARNGRRILGTAAQALQRAGTGRARLLHRAHHGPAKLVEAAQHRAPSGDGRHRRIDGAGIRGCGSAFEDQGLAGLLGEAGSYATQNRGVRQKGETVSRKTGLSRRMRTVRLRPSNTAMALVTVVCSSFVPYAHPTVSQPSSVNPLKQEAEVACGTRLDSHNGSALGPPRAPLERRPRALHDGDVCGWRRLAGVGSAAGR